MKPGDIIRLKRGMFAIPAGKELAILLSRKKHSGKHLLEVFTLAGVRVVDPKKVVDVHTLIPRYQGELDDHTRLGKALTDALSRSGERTERDTSARELARSIDERKLWERCTGSGPMSMEDIATAFWGRADTNRVEAVREVLTDAGKGAGYFPISISRELVPLTNEEYASAKEHEKLLRSIRSKLIIRPETGEEGEYIPVPVAEARLDTEQTDALEELMGWMKSHVATGALPPDALLGHSRTNALDGFSIGSFARELCNEWLSARLPTASAFIMFLILSGNWDIGGALKAITLYVLDHGDVDVHVEFGKDALADADALDGQITDDELERRRDLRELECYTIDPPDARDFDDAVSYELLPHGHRLGVHIADVTYYVKKDSRLDIEAYHRATSIYVPGMVVPQLPHRLSDDLCSLLDTGPRRTVTCMMEFDEELNPVSTEVFDSLIQVRLNLSYPDVVKAIHAGSEPFASWARFSDALRATRSSLTLETPEIKATPNPDGSIAMDIKHSSEATRMIETFMVAANQAVSVLLAENDIPQPFRVHPMPDLRDLELTARRLEALGRGIRLDVKDLEAATLELSGGGNILGELAARFGPGFKLEGGSELPEKDTTEDERTTPYDPERQKLIAGRLNSVLSGIRELDGTSATIHAMMCLRALPRAFYSPEELGHFGLGLARYTHFTSPIRRYADIVVHRQLKALGCGAGPAYVEEELEEICQHCSLMGENAEGIERKMINVCFALNVLREGRSGAIFQAHVTSITPSGIFVLLPGMAEGRVAIPSMGRTRPVVDEWGTRLLMPSFEDMDGSGKGGSGGYTEAVMDPDGERVILRIGQKVSVRLSATDALEGRTELELVRF